MKPEGKETLGRSVRKQRTQWRTLEDKKGRTEDADCGQTMEISSWKFQGLFSSKWWKVSVFCYENDWPPESKGPACLSGMSSVIIETLQCGGTVSRGGGDSCEEGWRTDQSTLFGSSHRELANGRVWRARLSRGLRPGNACPKCVTTPSQAAKSIQWFITTELFKELEQNTSVHCTYKRLMTSCDLFAYFIYITL